MTNDDGRKPEGAPERSPKAGVGAPSWIAVSQTNSALGAWFVYRDCQGGGIFAAGDLWDYDQLGMQQDAILITGNIFGVSSFKGAVVQAVPKSLIYNGFGFFVPDYAPDGGGPFCTGTIAPPIVQDANAYSYFVAMNFCDISKVRLFGGVLLANAFQAIYFLQADVPLPANWNFPPSATQPGTTEVIDTLDGRFQQSSSQYANFLWNVRADNLGGFPTPIFYQIDTSANAIVQSGFWFTSGTSNDWNPSIAASNTGGGDFAFVTWSSNNPAANINAQVRFSGRTSTDPAGSMIAPGTLLYQSTTALTANKQGSIQRWGDYSRVAFDPVPATCGPNQHAAVFNETILKSGTSNIWGTQFAIVGFCP
jgi:hypothetical protein